MSRVLLLSAGLGMVLLAGLGQTEEKKDPLAEHIASTRPLSPADERLGFHVPPGFEVQLVAAEPDIHKPINMAFDDRGRLWVTESVEYPFPARSGKPRDAVKILSDFGDDGRARKISTFADGLNIPIGVLPLNDGAIVYSIPNIYRMRDTVGNGWADERRVLYGRIGFADTHGMTSAFTVGFDGWMYACHGFSNTSTVRAADGSAVTMQSGNTYRMKLDGSHVEQFTHGQVNPFGLSWDPLGNLYSCDCHTQPIYQLLHGAWYPSFSKPNDGLGFGPHMMTHDHGSTAISGITYYAADHFPPEYRDTVFVGNVVTNRINHDRLVLHGSTPQAIMQPDFLKSDDPWYRPVDIKLGPDGALYVADFYNRIIGHYEVPLDHPGRDRERGRIWRIIYRGLDGKGVPKAPRSDWTTATEADLVQDLGHPNLVVRLKATNQLADRSDKSIDDAVRQVVQVRGRIEGEAPPAEEKARVPGTALLSPATLRRMHGIWVLERRHTLDDNLLTAAAQDPESAVRVHCQRILAERPELTPSTRELVLAGMKDTDALVQRVAADALGRHRSPENLRPLLNLYHVVPSEDTHLLYAVRRALCDDLQSAEAWAHLPTLSVRNAQAVADVSLGVPRLEAAQFLLGHLQRRPIDQATLIREVHHVARHAAGDTAEALLAHVRDRQGLSAGQRAELVKAMIQGTQERGDRPGDDLRDLAVKTARAALTSRRANEVQIGIELADTLKMNALKVPLSLLVSAHEVAEPQRAAAMTALVSIDAAAAVAPLDRVLDDAAEPIGLREHAVNMLARINQAESQARLVRSLPLVPARLQNAIAVGLAGSATGAEKLLEAVTAGKASARLLQEPPVQLRLQQSKLPNVKDRVAHLTQGLPPASEQVAALLQAKRQGFLKAKATAEPGAKVFEKHCAICHQLGGKGAKIGPQLDGVGIRGVDRLLEDILDPNRNVDQAFRSTSLTLKSGLQVSGLLLREEGEILVVADSQGKEVRVPKKSVEDRVVSQLSPMPGNFADQIPEAEFYQMVAYLLTQRPSK